MRAMMVMLVILLMATAAAQAESYGWVMCQPDSQVNIRQNPSKHSEIVAHAFAGDRITLTGRKKGKWLHCIYPCENGEGWIRRDYISEDEPEDIQTGIFQIIGDEVNVRYSAGGKIFRKLDYGTTVRVSMVTAEWSVTEYGFIQTRFLMHTGGT